MGYGDKSYTGEQPGKQQYTINRTDTDALVEAVNRLHQIEATDIEGPEGKKIRVLVVPKDREVQSLKEIEDEYRTRPERRKGEARFVSLQSFIDHAVRFKDKDSALFGEVDASSYNARLVSVLDYHRKGEGDPRFGEHRGSYAFPLSEEWKAWTQRSSKPMQQAEFAAFLEERLTDVMAPDTKEGMKGAEQFARDLGLTLAGPQQLLQAARNLSIKVNLKVVQHQVLQTGETQVSFEEKHEGVEHVAGAPVKIPGAFVIGIPVFRLGQPFAIPIRLMYRVSEGRVTWIIAPHRMDRAWEMAVTESCAKAQAATELPLFYGSPE